MDLYTKSLNIRHTKTSEVLTQHRKDTRVLARVVNLNFFFYLVEKTIYTHNFVQ